MEPQIPLCSRIDIEDVSRVDTRVATVAQDSDLLVRQEPLLHLQVFSVGSRVQKEDGRVLRPTIAPPLHRPLHKNLLEPCAGADRPTQVVVQSES